MRLLDSQHHALVLLDSERAAERIQRDDLSPRLRRRSEPVGTDAQDGAGLQRLERIVSIISLLHDDAR
jgi:hypothetical protein